MNRYISIVMAAFVVSGCSTTAVNAPPMNATEAQTQKAYNICMKKTGNKAAKCEKLKNKLLDEQDWDMVLDSN